MHPASRAFEIPSFSKIAAAVWCAGLFPVSALTYHISYLEDEGKRAQITAVMNEAVAIYNATTRFDVDINVIYHSGIPTAQADYNGQLGFGGSISTQVALHEIAHYLGSGTTTQWDAQWGGDNVWDGAAVRHFIKFFDGPGAELFRSGVHYYPYGFNYGNEDNPDARRRLPKLVQAMRFDMGFQDPDGDGMPEEWERYKMENSAPNGTGDLDGDGISNYDEWWTEGDPARACPVKSGRVYQIRARHSQKLIEVADTTAGSNVRQNAPNGSDLQKWTATYVGGGYWKFVNLGSGKALEVTSYSIAAGANIIAWNDTGGTNQQWRIVPDGAVYSKLFNNNSRNMVIDVDGGNGATANATNISQYFDVIGGNNQDWVFDDVTPGVPSDGLVANYKLDGNGRDFSGGNFHGVVTGGVTYGPGRVDGRAANFNGTNGSVEIPATVDTNFTLACWVKTSASAGGPQWYDGMGLVDAEVPGVAADFGLALVGGRAAFGIGAVDYTITSAGVINDGQWHHLAATLDTATGSMKLYVDAVLAASGNGPAGARFSPRSFYLGSISGTRRFFSGSLDEVRIYNKVLAATEISRLANLGTTRVASYDFDGNARDASQHGNHGIPVGTTYVAGKVGASALQFNGTSSFVKLPASVTADFSVAYWFKTTAIGGTGQWYAGKSMVDADVPGIANDWGISLVGDKIGFGMGNTGAGFTVLSTTPINNGVWHHVVATRVNGTGAMNLYIDGLLQAAGTGSTAVRDAPGGIRLGSTLFGGTYFAGSIDDLKIFNYALTAPQVSALVSPVGSPWTSADVGNPGSDGFAGHSSVGAGTYNLVGGGTDIGGTADQFQFVSAPTGGDRTLITRVSSAPLNIDGSATAGSKAGLMFRDSATAGSAFVGVFYDHLSGVRFVTRDAADALATQTGATVPLAAPLWLKITRIGDRFEAFYATTPSTPTSGNWLPLGARTTTLATDSLAGMALTSHNSLQVARTAFTGTSLALPSPGDRWRSDHFGTVANSNSAGDGADPDSDGLTNLMERALGLDPAVAGSSGAVTVLAQAASDVTFTYSRSLAASDLNYQVVWSTDLETWTSENVQDAVTGTTATQETHVATLPRSVFGAGAGGFLRLQVE